MDFFNIYPVTDGFDQAHVMSPAAKVEQIDCI